MLLNENSYTIQDMKNFGGIPIDQFNWKNDDGSKFDPDELYPVIDPASNRLYGIRKENESEVVVVQSYNPSGNGNEAVAFARMMWGKPEEWEYPNINNRHVTCIGIPHCATCIKNNTEYITDRATNWRVQITDPLSTDLIARRLIMPGMVEETITGPHAIADIAPKIDFLYGSVHDRRKEIVRKAIATFGRLIDFSTMRTDDPFQMEFTDMQVNESASQQSTDHYQRPEIHIVAQINRLFGSR